MFELIEHVQTDNKPANKCPDHDSDCVDVRNPAKCWIGNEHTGMAEGYCPLLFKNHNK